MGFLLKQYFPDVNIMILDALSGAFLGLLYWLFFGKRAGRSGSKIESYKPDQFAEIENSINWPKVGPEEMEMIGKLRNAEGVQAKVIMKELARREILMLSEEYRATAEERAEDTRYWVGLLLRVLIIIATFQAAGAFAFTYLRIDEWMNQPDLVWGRVFLALMIDVLACWFVLKLVNTDSWKRLIVTAVGFVVVLTVIITVYITTTYNQHMKELEKLGTALSKLG